MKRVRKARKNEKEDIKVKMSGHGWRFLTFCESHWRPSNRPSPVVAQLQKELFQAQTKRGKQYVHTSDAHTTSDPSFCANQAFLSPPLVTLLIAWSIKSCKGQIGYTPPGRSCLFAKTRSKHSFISRSLKIRCSSCLASSIRSRSWLSTTKTRPCVPV